jgi:hypothetical protein
VYGIPPHLPIYIMGILIREERKIKILFKEIIIKNSQI